MKRSLELPRIKQRRKATWKSIIGEESDAIIRPLQLTFKEFVIISTIHQMNMNYLSLFVDLVLDHGGIVVCVVYIILTALLGMPLSMLFTFLSSYSRKSYLAIWDCVPLFEGLGYSIALIRFTSECYNVLVAGISLSIMSDIIQTNLKNQLQTCKFPNAISVNKPCTSMSSTKIIANCTNNETHTALQYYSRFVVFKYSYQPEWESPVVNRKLLSNVGITWLLVFLLAIFGLKRLRRITINLQILFACVMAILVVLAVGRIDFKKHNWEHKSDSSADFKFWVDIILHAGETSVLGNLIWLGSMKPDCLDPKYAAIITTPIKILVLILVVCFTVITTQENMIQYKIIDKECFKPLGSEVLLFLIPDILFRLELWQAPTFLWYLSMFFFSGLATLYTLIGLVDSIIQKFNNLRKYSLVVCLILCVLGFLSTIFLTLNISSTVLAAWRHCGLSVLTATMSLLINLAIFFVYSTRKVIDDYIFVYGSPPERYWITLWKAAPIFSIYKDKSIPDTKNSSQFAFIFALTFQSRHFTTTKANVYVIWLSYLQSGSVLLPIFIIFIGRCCKNLKRRTLDCLAKPADDWGPVNPDDKIARKKFFPQRDIKYRNPCLKCKHKCLVANNARHMEEILIQERRFAQARKEMDIEKQINEDESDKDV